MPFWSKQPVFHIYNGLYWLRPPGIIDKTLPSLVDKYIDVIHIKTIPISEERTAQLAGICNFIKDNYIKDKHGNSQYTPTKNNILNYLQASNHISYCSIYQQPKLLFNKATPETSIDELVAVITASPLYVRLYNKKHQKICFPTYYVDNLCVHPAYRKKNIASLMIKTHYYNLRQQNKHIQTCLFKREGTLNAIVPLVAFNTYCIRVVAFNSYRLTLPPSISLIEITINQLHLLVDFMKLQMQRFECVILPDVTNLSNLLKTNNIKIYALIEQNNIIACYVFRLTEQYYDGEKAVECIATIAIANCIPIIFQEGFNLSLNKFENTPLVLIEDTAHAHILIEPILNEPILNEPILYAKIKFTSPTAFFFYNYASYSIKNKNFLIIY
jgi:hypothetical protein